MTALHGDRCITIIFAVLQSIVIFIKSTFQLLRPQSAKSLAGEVVLITGTGHGIGRQLAVEFWKEGCTVICVDKDEKNNSLTARDINSRHCETLRDNDGEIKWRAHAYKCDVMDRQQVAALSQKVQHDFGRVDILINNAASFPTQLQSNTVDVVNNNLLSHFWTVLAFLPGMIKRNHGHIVAVSPVSGLLGLTNKQPYSTSQNAIAGLMSALSEEFELGSCNVKLTCAHPYQTDHCDISLPELSPTHAASEIVNAVKQNTNTIIIPRNLMFWFNVVRILPQDPTGNWRDLFQAKRTTGVHNKT